MNGLPLPGPLPSPDPGLCRTCRHSKVVTSRTGSAFHLCLRSKRDPNFPRYPNLPVLACPGYQPRMEL
jgi:hypothetical protein